MMQTADTISHFFSYLPKRQLGLEEWIDSVLLEENKLNKMCQTWWVERHEPLIYFLFLTTFCCLQLVHQNWNRDMLRCPVTMSQFSFIVALMHAYTESSSTHKSPTPSVYKFLDPPLID